MEDKYESDESCAPSMAGMTAESDSSPYKMSSQSKTTSDTSSLEELKAAEKLNLRSTLSKIKNKPRLYLGVPKNLYFLIDLIERHSKVSEKNILFHEHLMVL